jgi:hypothetical protein
VKLVHLFGFITKKFSLLFDLQSHNSIAKTYTYGKGYKIQELPLPIYSLRSRDTLHIFMYMRSSLFWDVTQCRLLISHRRFRTTYRWHFQRPSNPRINSFFDFLTPENGTDRLSRNVGNYQATLRNIPEERSSHINSDGRLKSRRFMLRSWYRSTFQAVSVWYLLIFRVMRTKVVE